MIIPYLELSTDGSPLHFAHANAYPPGAYEQFLVHFVNDYHVWAIAHRPLWRDQQPEQMDHWHLITQDLIDFLEEKQLRDVVGMGHSLGAVVTMAAAVRRPELFRALVLIEPVFLPPDILKLVAAHPEKAFETPMVQTACRRRDRWASSEAAFRHFRSKEVFARVSDAVLWDYVRHGLDETADGVRLRFSREWEARFYATPPQDVWALIPQLTLPTLAVRGIETDTLLPPAWALWQQLQPEASFVEIDAAGHLVPLEKPAELTTAVRSFMDNIPPCG